MPANNENQAGLRRLPKVHALLETAAARALLALHPRQVVLDEVRAEVDALRQKVLSGEAEPPFPEEAMFRAIRGRLEATDLRRIRRAVNATGIVIHTNMGRAPLAEAAVQAVVGVARGYSNLELDLATGRRGGRGGQIGELLQRLTGAEAALIVNNNAAAALLALGTLAAGGDVVISRGELVEIGGGFRIPDVIRQSGARLVEVGATNKTRLSDYAGAIRPDTKVLLKVHTSNYRIVGFTEEVGLAALSALGQEHGLPVMNDLGSGALTDLTRWGLPYEPTVGEAIQSGADVATVSGDKLLGGPQCGIILGRAEMVGRMAANPLYRALRPDKMTLAALEATLRLYEDEDRLAETVPTLHMLSRTKEDLMRRARRLRSALAKLPGLDTRLTDGAGYTGGGALPAHPLPTKWVQARFSGSGLSVEELAARLRRHDPPVVGMLTDGWLTLDVRTVRDDEFLIIVAAVREAMREETTA